MKKFIAVLALAIATLVVPTASSAAVGKPFFKGISSPAELAEKIENSLKGNPKGTSMLDPARCKRDGSCARPLDYLITLQKSDPDARLTDVVQVPTFLRTLEVRDAPAGEYWISCLKPSGKGTFTPVLHCLSRSFKPGEKAWVNPKSGRVVFASDCTNPVEKPVPPKLSCVEIHFTTKPGDLVVRFALMGPASVEDDCVGVKKKGSAEFERLWKDECPDEHCGFRAPSQVVGQPVRLMGSYAPEPGEHVLRLPASVAAKDSRYVTGICIDWVKMAWPEKPMMEYTHARRDEYIAQRDEYIAQRDKWIAGHSDTIGVRWHDFLQTPSGTVATVYYTLGEVPVGKPKLYIPKGVWATDPEKHRQYWAR